MMVDTAQWYRIEPYGPSIDTVSTMGPFAAHPKPVDLESHVEPMR